MSLQGETMALNTFLFRTVSCAALVMAAQPALAQTAAPTTGPQTDQQEVVIVTARKRTENLQDVPLSISVLNAAAIERKGVDSVDDVASLTPGLTFDVGLLPTDTRISLRGVQAVRGRPNVAVLVDGVDTSSENFSVAGGGILANLKLVDVERIEVVKGPQNVLYGRAAFSGAINYITRRPSREREANMSVEIGNHGLKQIKAAWGTPIGGEAFRVRANAIFAESEGDYRSTSGGRLNGSKMWGGAVAAIYQPNDNFNAYFRVQHSDEEYHERAAVLLRSVNPVTGGPNTPDGGVLLPSLRPGRPINIYSIIGDVSQSETYRNSFIDLSTDPNNGGKEYPGTHVKTTRAALQMTWNTGFGELRSNSAMLRNESTFNEDFDHTNYRYNGNVGVPAYAVGGQFSTLAAYGQFGWRENFLPAYGLSGEFDANVEIEQMSQELLWTKEFGKARVLVDGLIWHEEAIYNDKSVFWLREGGNVALGQLLSFAQRQRGFHLAAPPPGGAISPQRITRETDSTSLGISFEYKLTDTLTIDLEGRYIKDEIVYTGLNFDPFIVNTYGAPAGGLVRSDPPVETEKFTPRVNVAWKAMSSLLIFGTYAQGTKPAGVDTTDQNGNVNDGRFEPESIDSYELGAKYQNASRSLTLGSSLFFNDYKDQQIGIIETVNGIPTSRTVNIGESITQGIEINAGWQPNRNWSFNGAYTNTNAEFVDYLLPRCGPVDSAESATATCDFKGKKLPQTAEHQATLSARYQRSLSDGSLFFIEGDTRYSSERFLSASNLAWLPSYTQTDIRGGIDAGKWGLTAYVDNLFGDDSPRTGTSSVDYGYFDLTAQQLPRGYLIAMAPKTKFGVRFNVDF
jgi:iron complex outermembrane recepter protein